MCGNTSQGTGDQENPKQILTRERWGKSHDVHEASCSEIGKEIVTYFMFIWEEEEKQKREGNMKEAIVTEILKGYPDTVGDD